MSGKKYRKAEYIQRPVCFVNVTVVKGCRQKKPQYIYRHYPNWGWPPSLAPYFWQMYFWHGVDHVDLPPSPIIFDKNHEILGFETCILYNPDYFIIYLQLYTDWNLR